ncbi:transglutaminase domain-containing protein [Lentzea jiangxiensis]|uniref:Transglutaminase-like superfamily protein n=1 Tax=Lentzea jiangxiensis TaxID=641025 RepID=A0A1H0X7R4_9PSEU|nr:transglutaminase domain-containing protein [Lentzea jiangxiensis]SDP98981.1 Transglutaminase-like superfamily protein [Lentzea jiangxiensis]
MSVESLRGTNFCDSESGLIQHWAKSLTMGLECNTQKAIRLFNFVQDGIKYSILHDWSETASQTLERGRGSCSNKATLLAALLRAVGIPSGFGVLTVDGKRYFGPMWIPQLQKYCDVDSRHFYNYVHLKGRWLRCDSSDDYRVSLGSGHFNQPCERVHFDGTQHADLHLAPEHVLERSGLLFDIDRFMLKSTKKPHADFQTMDRYFDFMREARACIPDDGSDHRANMPELISRLEEGFQRWTSDREKKTVSVRGVSQLRSTVQLENNGELT